MTVNGIAGLFWYLLILKKKLWGIIKGASLSYYLFHLLLGYICGVAPLMTNPPHANCTPLHITHDKILTCADSSTDTKMDRKLQKGIFLLLKKKVWGKKKGGGGGGGGGKKKKRGWGYFLFFIYFIFFSP